MRVEQPEGTRGSLKWIQRLLDRHPEKLDESIRQHRGIRLGETIEWLSPRRDDSWAEYRDTNFLNRIGHPELAPQLRQFWPRRGPQWDALGRGSKGTVVLVEAKAHFGELLSSCKASAKSRATIERALTGVKSKLGLPADKDWLNDYYQYANRLAHAQFLRDHGVQTTLVFLYFTNADMDGPASQQDWIEALRPVHQHLGLPAEGKLPGVLSLFIDSQQLA